MRHALSRPAASLAAAVVVFLAVVGCRSNREGAPPPEPRAESYVRVENRNMLDMTVYVVRGGERRRLGLVNALSSQMLAIPSVVIDGSGVIRFPADPVGANRTPVSEEIVVRHGDVVQLIIPPQ